MLNAMICINNKFFFHVHATKARQSTWNKCTMELISHLTGMHWFRDYDHTSTIYMTTCNIS